ncbi:12302_t:CDS:2, partial [Acaulospora colombiana]
GRGGVIGLAAAAVGEGSAVGGSGKTCWRGGNVDERVVSGAECSDGDANVTTVYAFNNESRYDQMTEFVVN